jgi:SAM-dependent methyltransferase
MSRWTDQWRDFVRETSYVHSLAKEKISNDQFWRSYGIYDQVLRHSGYPGEVLAKISSFISTQSTLLDIGAGTGAFAVPLSRKTSKTFAVDPSAYQLQILSEKARQEGLTNIITIEKEWKEVEPYEISKEDNSGPGIPAVDYTLAAYSLFDVDIENFLARMIAITRKGIFIVYPRNYALPIDLVLQQYRFSSRSHDELLGHLGREGRLQERDDGLWATCKTTDALLYMIR